MGSYIRVKQKLIKLLEEQKQAIITGAVTRGLDPNVRLKPSGVEWLPDVPEDWRVRQLGRCLRRIDQGWSPVAAEGELDADQWAVLTLSSVRRGVFNRDAIKPVPHSAQVPSGIQVRNGDLLLTRSNTRDLVGDACIVHNSKSKTVICDLMYRLVPDSAALNESYLMFQLLSRVGRYQIERDARGSSGTMPKIAQRHIRSWQVVVPPLDEQAQIVRSISKAIEAVSQAVTRATAEITLVREFRTKLIADVVTGKLDVREVALQLPVEPEDLESFNDRDADISPDAETSDASDETPEPIEA